MLGVGERKKFIVLNTFLSSETVAISLFTIYKVICISWRGLRIIRYSFVWNLFCYDINDSVCVCILEKVCAGLSVIKGHVSHEYGWWELFISPATSKHIDAYATVVVVLSITSLSATGWDSAISLFKGLVIFEIDQVSSWYKINTSPCLPFPVLFTPFACDAMDPLDENFLPEDSKFPSASSLLFFSFLLLCRAFNCFSLLEKNFVLPVCSPFTSYWKQRESRKRN